MRILDETHGTGAVTRVLLDSSDGEREWGTIGVSENIIEASWEALVDSLEYAFQPQTMSRQRPPTIASRSRSPGPSSASARRSWCSRCCARAGSRWARWASASSASFADWLGVEDAVAVSSGTTALHLGVRALGWGAGDEVLTSPFSFVASANCLLYEGARPVFCDVDPVTLDLDPAAAAAARRRAHRRASCRSTSSATRRRCPSWRRSPPSHGLGILEDACEALGAVDSEGRAVGARGNLATFAFYANKQMTTGEGGMVVPSGAARPRRACASERNQGRAADMGWLDHGGLGFNYRLSDLAAALGVAQVEKLDALLGAARRGRRALRASGLAGIEGVEAPIAGRGAERRSWFVYAGPPRRPSVDRDATIARLAERGIASKAYLPCIHLFPHLRELGYREGQFPVAEAASARSLALPFFPSMSEAQVDAGVRGSRP